MPFAIFDWAPFCAMVLPMWTMLTVIPVIKAITWLLLSRLQGNKPHRNSREPSRTRLYLHQHTPELSGIFRNLPRPSGTYLLNLRQHTRKSSGTVRNLPPEPTPFYSGTLRNLPEPASGTHRNSPEPSGTFQHLPEPTPAYTGTFRNLPELASGTDTILWRNSPEPSGTFRNLPPERTPACVGTFRNFPEPASGTCSCDSHRHTPELIWAEDPSSLRCWGKKGNWHLRQLISKGQVVDGDGPQVKLCGKGEMLILWGRLYTVYNIANLKHGYWKSNIL